MADGIFWIVLVIWLERHSRPWQPATMRRRPHPSNWWPPGAGRIHRNFPGFRIPSAWR